MYTFLEIFWGGFGPSVRLLGPADLLFGGILVYRGPPLTPLMISFDFYHMILTHSIS